MTIVLTWQAETGKQGDWDEVILIEKTLSIVDGKNGTLAIECEHCSIGVDTKSFSILQSAEVGFSQLEDGDPYVVEL